MMKLKISKKAKIAYFLLLAAYTCLLFVLFRNQAYHLEYQYYGSDVDA